MGRREKILLLVVWYVYLILVITVCIGLSKLLSAIDAPTYVTIALEAYFLLGLASIGVKMFTDFD